MLKKKTIFEFIRLLKKLKPQEYFLVFLVIFWTLFDLFCLKETKLAFALILFASNIIVYTFWVTGNLKKLFWITFLMLLILRLYMCSEFKDVAVSILIFIAVFFIFMLMNPRRFLEEKHTFSDAMEKCWEEEFNALYLYKESTTLLGIFLIFSTFTFRETIFYNSNLHDLWTATGLYSVTGHLIHKLIRVWTILNTYSISYRWLKIIYELGMFLYIIFMVSLWLHIVCTAPGFSPLNFLGVGLYQEMVLGYRAPTTEQLLIARVYSFINSINMDMERTPPLIEGTLEVDFYKTLGLIAPLSEINKFYVLGFSEIISEWFPFTKKVFMELLNGLGAYDISNLKEGLTKVEKE